jgi:hypothetical protein
MMKAGCFEPKWCGERGIRTKASSEAQPYLQVGSKACQISKPILLTRQLYGIRWEKTDVVAMLLKAAKGARPVGNLSFLTVEDPVARR